MKHTSLILLIIGLLLSNCKNSKDAAESNMDYKTIATEKLGDKVVYTPNEDRSMMLCMVKTQLPNMGGSGASFFVYDNESKSIVYEEKISRGTVSWYSDKQLALYYTPGIMAHNQTSDDYTYIYHLDTKVKIVKSKYLKSEDL